MDITDNPEYRLDQTVMQKQAANISKAFILFDYWVSVAKKKKMSQRNL